MQIVEESAHRIGPTEVIESIVDVESPVGEVTVQLTDGDTGKVVQKETKNNFVSRLWAYNSRSWQRTMWSAFPLNQDGLEIDTPVYQAGGRLPYFWPGHYVAAWNDPFLESPSQEHRVRTDSKGLVAFASRVPTGDHSGKRGAVNVSESSCGEDGEVMVWDWGLTEGNGTFRSVGLCAVVDLGSGIGVPGARPSLIDRKYYRTGSSSLINNYRWGNCGLDLAGNMVTIGRVLPTSAASQSACMVIPVAEVNTGFTLNPYGAGEKEVTPTEVWSAQTSLTVVGTGGGYHGFRINFIGEYGGEYWAAARSSSADNSIISFNKTTGAQTKATVFNTSSRLSSVGCIIGSEAFVCVSGDGTNPSISRMNLTASPNPTLTATITVSYPSGWNGFITGMCTDGTDLYLNHSHGGVIKIDTSGNVLDVIGRADPVGEITLTSSAPYASAKRVPMNPFFTPGAFRKFDNVASTGAEIIIPSTDGFLDYNESTESGFVYPGSQGHLLWINGEVHGQLIPAAAVSGGIIWGYAALGWNLGTRVLLGSEYTKTSSNNMKITYTMNLPRIVP